MAHFLIQLHCFTLSGDIISVTRLRRRERQSGPYSAELMAHFPMLKMRRMGESLGLLANCGPRWIRASWMRSASVTIIKVR